MHAWPTRPYPQSLAPGAAEALRHRDQRVKEVTPPRMRTGVGMYAAASPRTTPPLGHAATYLTFDLAQRQLLANGHKVHYVQNITDVDDPLFERAEARRGLARTRHQPDQLFRSDMEILSVIPPRDYIGAMGQSTR
ncbi:hypothetical protein [Corynebacterium urealyticum]|uniref:hypothetical protein n=1 Tax=Corynebacterium urealyticum TaxID=43771 RepID=UPI001F1F8F46|nr:hypothetical protein [Corynebacterium urealyticum]